MATKKKFKLKKKFKRLILYIILLGLLVFAGFKGYNYYEYTKTIEYNFLNKGYDSSVYKLINEKLSKEHIEYLLNEEKIDYIDNIIGEKYFIDDNFFTYLEYYEANDQKSFKDIVAIVNVGSNKNWYEGAHTIEETNETMLINKFAGLPDEWDVGNIKKFSSTYAYGEVSAEESCYNAFITMAKAAKEDGITLILTSGYRSTKEQTDIYNDYKNRKGEAYADSYAARPGHSEHETGLALDILTYGGLTDTFKYTETYAWLHTNSYKYGFIERYPEGKEYLTGYLPEAWHYRYLGVELATKVYEEGITYDEYYAFYNR